MSDISKATERIIEAIKEAGPTVEYGFNEAVKITVMMGWMYSILIVVALPVTLLWLRKAIKDAEKHDYWTDSSTLNVVLASIAAFISVLMFVFAFTKELSMAIHPIGYLVLEALR